MEIPMLKTVLDSTEGLDPAIAKEYVKGDDGKFYLDHSDRESIANLSRARDHEKNNHGQTKNKLTEAQNRLTELETQIEELRTNGMTKDTKSEVDRLTKLHAKELEKVQGELKGLKGGIEKQLLESTAKGLSKDLTESDEILSPHIQKRLSVSFDKGAPELVVLDKDGQPSAQSLADLKKEFSENKAFASFIKGSGASGGGRGNTGAGGSGGAGGAGGYNPNASVAERAAYHRSKIST